MKKVFGILGLLIAVVIGTSILNPQFLRPMNLENTARWTGLFGIPSIGVALVIITGGIDLSVGSVIGLAGSLLAMLVHPVNDRTPMAVAPAIAIVMGVSAAIGLVHGLLITKLRLQPFVVTLCGLLLYRGLARYVTDDATQGFGTGFGKLKYLAKGTPVSIPLPGDEAVNLPMPFLLLIAIGLLAGVFLNLTIYGRYLIALGRNEQAARYSGINTDRIVIAAYVISAVLAGFAGILFALDLNSIQPSGHGSFYELYAIAAAVLGGCSLRGGEGTILGVILGAAVMRVLYNAINLLGIATQLEFAVIGVVILLGVVTDELVKRLAARRQRRRGAG